VPATRTPASRARRRLHRHNCSGCRQSAHRKLHRAAVDPPHQARDAIGGCCGRISERSTLQPPHQAHVSVPHAPPTSPPCQPCGPAASAPNALPWRRRHNCSGRTGLGAFLAPAPRGPAPRTPGPPLSSRWNAPAPRAVQQSGTDPSRLNWSNRQTRGARDVPAHTRPALHRCCHRGRRPRGLPWRRTLHQAGGSREAHFSGERPPNPSGTRFTRAPAPETLQTV